MSALLPYGFEFAMLGGSVLLCLGGVVVLVCLMEHPSKVGEENTVILHLLPPLACLCCLSYFLFTVGLPSPREDSGNKIGTDSNSQVPDKNIQREGKLSSLNTYM